MLDDISRLATCKICQIASSLRVCGECKFRNAWTGLDAVVLEVPPDFRSVSEPGTAEEAASAMLIGAPSLKDMSLADQKDWFAGVLERRF